MSGIASMSTAGKSNTIKTNNDSTKIHDLYQNLYLTDLKNEIDEIEDELSSEKEKNLQLT